MKNIINNLLALIVFSSFPAFTNAADISLRDPSGIKISGKIEIGDYQKLKDFLISKENLSEFTAIVELDSPGGNVDEAIKISNLLKWSFAKVAVLEGDVCFSSCVIVYAGGVNRILLGKLGVHRISFVGDKVSIKVKTAQKSKSVENHLEKMGVPRKIIQKMNETSPSHLFIIDRKYLIDEGLLSAMEYQPDFIGVAEKECGLDPIVKFGGDGLSPSASSSQDFVDCIHQVRAKNFNAGHALFVSILMQ